jgi:HSP20 family protein
MPRDWWDDWDEARRRMEKEFRRMHDEMERVFSFGVRRLPPPFVGKALATTEKALATAEPSIDLIDQENELIITTDLPGIEKGDINISVRDNQLEISAEMKEESKEKREGYLRRERTCSQYYRKLSLPAEVNEEKVKATFKNGVLEITLPKKQVKKGKKVKID